MATIVRFDANHPRQEATRRSRRQPMPRELRDVWNDLVSLHQESPESCVCVGRVVRKIIEQRGRKR